MMASIAKLEARLLPRCGCRSDGFSCATVLDKQYAKRTDVVEATLARKI